MDIRLSSLRDWRQDLSPYKGITSPYSYRLPGFWWLSCRLSEEETHTYLLLEAHCMERCFWIIVFLLVDCESAVWLDCKIVIQFVGPFVGDWTIESTKFSKLYLEWDMLIVDWLLDNGKIEGAFDFVYPLFLCDSRCLYIWKWYHFVSIGVALLSVSGRW